MFGSKWFELAIHTLDRPKAYRLNLNIKNRRKKSIIIFKGHRIRTDKSFYGWEIFNKERRAYKNMIHKKITKFIIILQHASLLLLKKYGCLYDNIK